MNELQKRRLASFVVARENLRYGTVAGLRCILADYRLMPNGSFVVEVKWQVWGTPSIQPPLCLTLPPQEVERLRHVWSNCAPNPKPVTEARDPSVVHSTCGAASIEDARTPCTRENERPAFA